MRKTIITIITIPQLQFVTPTLFAAVPLSWTVETTRAQPATFEAYQGETLSFEAALKSHGKPLEAPLDYSFFWQTNGMGSTYWEAPCPIDHQLPATNLLRATWHPSMDVGAKVYNCFIGSPSNIYHAAFQLRLRPSPGWTPNALPLPVPVIDFAKVRVLNPPWPGCGGGGVDTNAVIDIANATIATNPVVAAKLTGEALTNHNNDNGSHAIAFAYHNADAAAHPDKIGEPGGKITGELEMRGLAAWLSMTGGASIHIKDTDAIVIDQTNTLKKVIASKADLSMIDHENETFSNEVATVARTVTPPPSPTLRLYDEVRQCYWLGKMVNGVMQWEVE